MLFSSFDVLLLIPVCLELLFWNKRGLLYRFIIFQNHQILEQVEKTTWKTRELIGWVSLHFTMLLEIDVKSHAFSMCSKGYLSTQLQYFSNYI